jgi:hypothetical protein
MMEPPTNTDMSENEKTTGNPANENAYERLQAAAGSASESWMQAFDAAAEKMNIGSYSPSAKSVMMEMFRRGFLQGQNPKDQE